jgi:hypothetical protein
MRIHSCIFSNAVRRGASGILLAALTLLITGAGEAGAPPVPVPSALPAYPVREPVTRAPQQPIQIGDRLTLQVEVSPNLIPPGQTVNLRPLDPKSTPEDQGWFIDPRPSNQLGIIRFIASPLKGGSVSLPELVISIENGDPVARTQPVTFEVQELKSKPEGQPDLIDVLPVQVPLRFWVYALLLLCGLVVLGRVLYLRYLKNKKSVPPPAPPALPPEPDHAVARKRIEALFAGHDFAPESLKPLAFGVSEVLKVYFSKRFEIDARESTTGEMLQLLRSQSLERQDLHEIRSLFESLDQFKFLDVESFPECPPERRLELKTAALRIIDRWTPGKPAAGGAP